MTRALSCCALVYASALIVGIAVTNGLAHSGMHPLWIALLADVAATVVVFGSSFAFDNSSLYDPYWSVAPTAIGAYFARLPAAAAANGPRQILVLALVAVWGFRLTYNF